MDAETLVLGLAVVAVAGALMEELGWRLVFWALMGGLVYFAAEALDMAMTEYALNWMTTAGLGMVAVGVLWNTNQQRG